MVAGSTGEAEDWAASGPAARVLLALIRGYKVLISPYFAGSCRFLPSCADYAREAVMRHGALRGGWLAVKRLARCHPFCASGDDAVPLRRSPLPRRPIVRIGSARPRHEQVARAAVGAGGGASGQ